MAVAASYASDPAMPHIQPAGEMTQPREGPRREDRLCAPVTAVYRDDQAA